MPIPGAKDCCCCVLLCMILLSCEFAWWCQVLWCDSCRRPSAINRKPVNQAPQHCNPPHHICQPPHERTSLFIATREQAASSYQKPKTNEPPMNVCLARPSIVAEERARRSWIRHGVDRWHREGRRNRVLVVRRQQVTQSVTVGCYHCCQLWSRNWPWRPLMEEGDELWIEEKHCQNREKWAWEVTLRRETQVNFWWFDLRARSWSLQ